MGLSIMVVYSRLGIIYPCKSRFDSERPTKLNDRNMNTIDAPKQRIKAALLAGIRLTTAQGNRLASTVDFRKIISRLREEGLEIKDFWNIRKDREGRTVARYKTYYIDSPLPAKGTRIAGFGEPEIEQLF